MFDNIKEKFENEPKVKRNVIITTAVLATLFAATVVVVNVADNDKDFGSEKSGIVAEAEAQDMGNYTATVSVDTKVGAEELLRMSVKQEEGITPLSASNELDVLSIDGIRVCFKDESVEKEYKSVGNVDETILAISDTGVYEYKVSVKVVGATGTEKPKTSVTTTTTTVTTTSKATTTTTSKPKTTTTTTKKVEEKKPAKSSNAETTGGGGQPSGGNNSGGNSGGGNSGGSSGGGNSGGGYVPETPKPVVTQAPVTTTPAPVVTEPPAPVVTEPPKPANNEPTGNFCFEGMRYKIDRDAHVVYENQGGAGWNVVISADANWSKFCEAWNLEGKMDDNIAYKCLMYSIFSAVTYTNCDVIYIPSCWTVDDVYNNYGLEFDGRFMSGTYVDETGEGMYRYAG